MDMQPKKKSGIFASLSDDLLGQVVNKVKDRKDRKSFSLVCKQWLKVEGLDRSWLTISGSNPRASGLDAAIKKQKGDGGILSPKGLCALGEGCPKLSHVQIYGPNAIGNSGVVELVHSAHNLESLVLMNNMLISDGIGSTSSITSLELYDCDNITDEGLASLANGSTSKTLKKLIIEFFRRSKITDTGVENLRKMCRLEHLKLSLLRTRSGITDIGGMGIAAIRTLKELWLNFLDVSDPTMVALAQNCRNLEKLNIRGCEKVTGAGIRAFCSHKCLKCLTLDDLKINLVDVEQLVFGCPSLESVVVDGGRKLDPTWSHELMHDKTRKVVKFVVNSCLDDI